MRWMTMALKYGKGAALFFGMTLWLSACTDPAKDTEKMMNEAMLKLLLINMMTTPTTGASGSSAATASCDSTTLQGLCEDYRNGDLSKAQGDCTTLGGTYLAGGTCSGYKRVGSCKLTTVYGTELTRRYYSWGNNYTTGSAQSACTYLGGTFTAN